MGYWGWIFNVNSGIRESINYKFKVTIIPWRPLYKRMTVPITTKKVKTHLLQSQHYFYKHFVNAFYLMS